MIIVTSDYDYNINKLDETRNIVENTILKHEQKNGGNYGKVIKVKCLAEILDKMKKQNRKHNH